MRINRYGQIGHPFAQILAKNRRFLTLSGLVLVFFVTSYFTKTWRRLDFCGRAAAADLHLRQFAQFRF